MNQVRHSWRFHSGRFRAALVLVVLWTVLAAAAWAAKPDPVAATQHYAEAVTRFDEGQYALSAASFDLAAELFKGSLFADDAGFGNIRAQEAVGDDVTAQANWTRWLSDHPDSPLQVEASLALAWNQVRQDRIDQAETILDELRTAQPWLSTDQRLLTLKAATAYLRQDWNQTIIPLEMARQHGPLEASALMLLGLAHQALHQDFAAAVAYQELIDDHRASHLTGYAFMAKAGIFPGKDNHAQAAQHFARAAQETTRPDHQAELRYLEAACLFLSGQEQSGLESMREVAVDYAGTDLAARALFSMGEMRWRQSQYEQAIVRFNEILSGYFDHTLAGSALYRTGRCLDALGRTLEANSSYQAVAQGHPYAPEAPAAVYLAGVGLYEQERYLEAAPYFQLVLDRYAGPGNAFVFESPAHQELVEASLCLLEFSFHQAGETGLMAGAPHLALQKMPPSTSLWRAYTLLLDADALAAVDRYAEAQESLAMLLEEFPDHPVGIRANRLLAWTYARQGRQDLAIETERTMLARYSAQNDQDNLAAALLNMAHSHFNAKRYAVAGQHYREFSQQYPTHTEHQLALYQEGLCHVRTGRAGDAIDCWRQITDQDPAGEVARRAWLRSGDILFQSGHFAEARVCFEALRQHFPDREAQVAGLLRLGRCDYNEGKGPEALVLFRQVAAEFPDSQEADEASEGITSILYSLGLEGESEHLRQLVAQHPDSPLAPEAGFQLAMRLYQSDQFDEAATAFADLAGRYPRYSAADRNFYYAADAQLKAGHPEDAFARWETFLGYFPHSDLVPAALLNLGNLKFNRGQYHPAVQDFQEVLARTEDLELRAAALYNLAMSQRILGQEKEAQNALEQYIAQAGGPDPRLVTVIRTLGEIHQDQGHFGEAGELFRQAATLDDDPFLAVELHYLAGQCLKQSGDTAGALVAYAESIASPDKTNNFRLSALAQSADLYEQSGDFTGALQAYRDLVKHATDPALAGAARERLTQLEAALGQ
jgi:TolA-binding protein